MTLESFDMEPQMREPLPLRVPDEIMSEEPKEHYTPDLETISKEEALDSEGKIELLVQIASESRVAVERILQKYPDLVDDVLNIALTKAIMNLPNFRHESKLSSWFLKIAKNEALMVLRKNKNSPNYEDIQNLEVGKHAAEIQSITDRSNQRLNPEQSLLKKEKELIVRKAVKSLGSEFRDIVDLYYNEGLQTKQIAEVLGLNHNTVKTRLNRAREILAKKLDKLGPKNGKSPE